MIYKLTMLDGKEITIPLSDEQVMWIERHTLDGVMVPLYSTTMAKRKYGDCKMGDIINITSIQND